MSTQPMLATDRTVHFDCSVNNESITYQMLPFSQIPNRDFFFYRDDDTTANTVTVETASASDTFLDGTTSFTMKVGDAPRHVLVPNSGKALVFVGASGTTSSSSSSAGASGSAAASSAPVTQLSSLTATAFINPISGAVTVSINAADSDATVLGCDFYAEIPDISSSPAFVVGQTAIGSQASVAGQWVPIPMGKQYFTSPQPWTANFPAPPSIDPTQNTTMRLYGCEFNSTAENPLIEANQANPTTNVLIQVISLASGSPTAGTNVTAVSGPIAVTVLPADLSTGKSLTPFIVEVSSVPTGIPGWCYRLILTIGGADPTQAANQRVVTTGLYSMAGFVPSGTDGIATPHSFAVPTPTSITQGVVWLQSGLVDASGHFQGNNIVPGITPQFPVTYGTTGGTTDASTLMPSTLASSLGILSGFLGVPPAGITYSLMAANSVGTTNLQALSVTNPILGNLAVAAANMGANSVTAVNGAIAALAVVAGNLAANSVLATNMTANSVTAGNGAIANLAVGTAQIQNLAITNALVNDVSASKITAGTITATVSMTSPVLTITGSPFTINIDSMNGIKCTGNSITTTITNNVFNGSATGLLVTDGTNYSFAAAGSIGVAYGSTFFAAELGIGDTLGVNGGKLVLTNTSGASFTLDSTALTTSSTPSGFPSSPSGFLQVKISGTVYRIAYY